ncbi:MAG: hypothetical protein AAGH81_04315 [Bacteroidota bacterium]
MATDLDLLIDFYQWEIVRIKKSIEENLELRHYKEVEFDQRALGHAQSELDRLLELKNPLHRRIEHTKQTIEMYKRAKQKRDLHQFEKIKVESVIEESQLIDEAIL